MLIGDIDYPVEEAILFFILTASLIFNYYLFHRGQGNYSIKYQLMRNEQFFRQHKFFTNLIEGLYKFFFALPFLLLIVLSILAAIRNPRNLPPILINGLIILLILYPTKRQLYYYKLAAMGLLAFGSQISTFFIYEKEGQQAYSILSFIFYTGNIIFFYLAILSVENVYWEISTAIQKNKQAFAEVNQTWATDPVKMPKVFDGGLYGFFCKNQYKAYVYLILYGISLLFLIAYSLIVYFVLNSKLGFVGLVSAFIYDIFLQIFNTLDNKIKSNQSLFVVLVFSRLLSFIFGIQNWLLGYCVLYFFVSVFIGWIIIDKHFPMTVNTVSKDNKKSKFINALKTPQFVLFLLTIQIIGMLLFEAYGLSQKDPTVTYNNVTIPIWQWGLLTLASAWVIIIYSLSIRILNRHKNKIYNLVQYYFGVFEITESHLYLFVAYIILIGFGFYSLYYLQDKILLTSCIFIPLIYITLSSFYVTWQGNQYMILANIDQYNRIMQKKVQAHNTRNQIMSKMNTQRKKKLMYNSLMKKTSVNQFSLKSIGKFNQREDQQNQAQMFATGEISGGNLKPIETRNSVQYRQGDSQQKKYTQKQFIPLINWRNPDEKISCHEIWNCLTPKDKKIIIVTIIFLLLSIGYILTSILWAKSKFAISIMVCVISYLTLFPYFKFYKTKQEVLFFQIIMNWAGFGLGIGYWSVFMSQVVGPLCFSLFYLLLAVIVMIQCYRTQFLIKIIINPILQIICCIAFVEVTAALYLQITITVIFGIIFFILLVLQAPLYCMLKFQYVPKFVIILSSILIGGVIICISVLGYVFNKLNSFSIFTIVMVFIFLAFYFAAVGIFIHKLLNIQQSPNVYSAYGEPHYKFDSAKQLLKSNTLHLVLFSFSMTTVLMYSVVVSIFFDPKQWAIYGLSFFMLMEFFVSLQISISSYIFIGGYHKQKLLTDQIITQSLLKLKKHYLVDQIQGQDSPVYQKNLAEARQIAEKQGGSQNWRKVVQYHDLYVKNQHQEQKFCFFWITLIMFNLMAKKKQKIAETLAQLKSIESQLNQSGVILKSLSSNLKPKQKYQNVLKQIQNLQHVDYVLYEQILQNHRQHQKLRKKQNQQAHKKQLQQQQKRDQQIYQQLKQKQDITEKQQIAKFKRLTKNLGRKNLFTDQQFPANQTILGNELNEQVKKWRRPTQKQILYLDGISASDVKQGAIGDCYLISSFAVLGQKNILQAFGQDSNGTQIWRNEKGAYMVRFYKFLKEVYIIVDDLLPLNQVQEWVFAKSQQSSQFWPCILEKAYAKMHGGYDKIVSGKCHQVFSQFTNGFPYQIIIQEYKSNPFGLWNQIVSSKKNGYLLGAGSPAHAKGDKAFSKRKIVQGHAYAILDARQVDDYKLIKLKNPHGSEGMQWNGDFSDNSDQMTPNRMKFLNHTKTKDGIFWMPLQDFIIQFRSVYVCAVFDDRWLKFKTIHGQWTQQNSFGTPNNIEAYKNPHYGIRVTKKSVLFVSLTQQSVTALKGKNFIFIKALKNKGKRITIQSLKSTQNAIGKQKRPTDAATISLQLQLQAQEYPYVFSLMITCAQAGKTGKYILQAYCDDKNASIIEDQQFDRKNI